MSAFRTRVLAVFASASLVASLGLAGCGSAASSASSSAPSNTSQTQSETPTKQAVDDWVVYDGTTPAYTDDEKAVFDQAVESAANADYELVRVLGTQVVAGTNYVFLARDATVAADPHASWYVVVAYQDLQGKVSLTSAEPVDLADLKTTSKVSAPNVTGGWELRDPANAVLEPKEAGDAFAKASESYADAALYPIATLGSQTEEGTSYLVLCEGIPTSQDARAQLYLATLHVDSQDAAQLADVRVFDLLAYIGTK